MNVRSFPDIRRRAPAIGLVMLYSYLAFHALSGSQGVVKWMGYADQTVSLQTDLTRVEARRTQLEAQVKALRPSGLDLDTLEISARRELYVSDPKEITIWLDR